MQLRAEDLVPPVELKGQVQTKSFSVWYRSLLPLSHLPSCKVCSLRVCLVTGAARRVSKDGPRVNRVPGGHDPPHTRQGGGTRVSDGPAFSVGAAETEVLAGQPWASLSLLAPPPPQRSVSLCPCIPGSLRQEPGQCCHLSLEHESRTVLPSSGGVWPSLFFVSS